MGLHYALTAIGLALATTCAVLVFLWYLWEGGHHLWRELTEWRQSR